MRPRIALLLLSLTGGGVERSTLRLAREFVRRGVAVDLLVCRPEGELAGAVPDGVRLVPLADSGTVAGRLAALRAAGRDWPVLLRPVALARHASRALRHLPALARYLEHERPAALLSAKTPVNLTALWARRLTGQSTRLVVSERAQLSAIASPDRPAKRSHLPKLATCFYSEAAAIVAVSSGVADDFAALTDLPRERIEVIYNPVIEEDFERRAAAPAPHPWLTDDGPPVILAIGRLHPEKDYPTLLRALVALQQTRPARLLIFGEGPQRQVLESLVGELGLNNVVALPGFVANPLPALSQARVFVLCSRNEGLPGALIEALACGCPVVSTDCPSGPREILDHGRYGPLVPVGDPDALAMAILATLDAPVDRAILERRGRTFSAGVAAEQYLRLLLPAAATSSTPNS